MENSVKQNVSAWFSLDLEWISNFSDICYVGLAWIYYNSLGIIVTLIMTTGHDNSKGIVFSVSQYFHCNCQGNQNAHYNS